MLSDDTFRTELAATFADLKTLASTFATSALIDTAATRDFVRLSLIPKVAGACPVEIMLRADQLYDIAVGAEFYEDRPIESFALFKPLLAAITAGAVVQRRHVSAVTGAERAIETLVPLPGGKLWRNGHVHAGLAAVIDEQATLFRDKRFLPYRRG